MSLGFDPLLLAWIALASLVAFIVRGLSGFGSAMIGIGGLTLVLPPVQVVPAFFALELLTTVNLLPGVWRRIDWRSLRWVIAGCAVTTPVGLTLLAHLDPDPMRLVVSGCLATIALLMRSGGAQRFTPRTTPGPLGALAAGGASGLLNGAAGIPGPPAIVFYFATTGTAVSRASLVAFFLFTDGYGLAWAGGAGLLAGVGWNSSRWRCRSRSPASGSVSGCTCGSTRRASGASSGRSWRCSARWGSSARCSGWCADRPDP
jgi:uncharacterized membrane protein YfcA